MSEALRITLCIVGLFKISNHPNKLSVKIKDLFKSTPAEVHQPTYTLYGLFSNLGCLSFYTEINWRERHCTLIADPTSQKLQHIIEMTTCQSSQIRQQFSPDRWFREDAKNYFDRNTDMIYGFWSQFTINTDVDEGTTIPNAMDLLRATDEATVNKDNTYWQRRLAYLQLHRNLQVLKRIVGRERRRRQIDRSRGRGNSSIALEIYSNALRGKTGTYVSHQMRLAKRWSLSLRKSLFLAVAYSDFAGARMYAMHTLPL